MPFWPHGELLLGGGQNGRPTRLPCFRGYCSLVPWRPPRIPVWLPLDQTVPYFITICVGGRRPVLDNPEIFGAILKICDVQEQWETVAAVVMPDHLHALVRPLANRDAKITQYSAGLKRFVRRETKATWKWQDGVFDRLLRRNESAESKWIYMRENPLRAGLVRRWKDWPYAIGYNV